VKANVVIIGGGITGISIAYWLVKMGIKDIIVFEESYLGSGSTFKCATGIRASFTTEEHIVLMKYSIDLWKKLSEEHGFPYLRGGYLWLLTSEEQVKRFEKIREYQNSLGVPTRLISVEEIKRIVPSIRENGLIAALHDPLAGKACPFEALHSLAGYIKAHGGKIYTNTKVDEMIVSHGEVKGVKVSNGIVESSTVVIAAGYKSREVASTAGLDLPLHNLPRHIIITESYNRLFDPLLINVATGDYIVQTFDGGFIMGVNLTEEHDIPLTPRMECLNKAVKIWVKYFPWLTRVHVLRYWMGYYVMSPDHHPILGPVDEIKGLYLAVGFSGHGFMMAPIVGKVLAEWIITGKPSVKQAENLTLKRIEEGRLIHETAVFG